jgi:inositol oxygenase
MLSIVPNWEHSISANPNGKQARTMDAWEEDLLQRYPEPSAKMADQFRDYGENARDGVAEFYRQNHRYQCVEFVRRKRAQYLGRNRCQMSIWEAMEFLNELVDDSDPDLDLPQIEHLLQTAEAIRADGHPSWFILTGLVHDLGKILCLWGEPQWAVVGDTFPVGCAFSDKIVYAEAFEGNPDHQNPRFASRLGMYQANAGLDQVLISWGHDEYMYHVAKDYLPAPALAMIRFHSCYPIHREGEYAFLMNDQDHEAMNWVRAFNPYDLYTKRDQRMDVQGLRPFYEDLISQYFPAKIDW